MKRRCLLVLVPAVALVLLCVPAEAKGRDPVKAVIRGPGLVEPIVIRGSMGSGPGDRYWAFLLPMFGSLSDPSSESPLSTGDLGPRYFVDYVELCCGHRVRQYLYPYAAGGPVTHTPAGQRSDMFQMNMDDYIGSQTGWHRVATTLDTTSSFVGWHRVAATLLHLSFAQSGVNPTAAPATSNPSRLWLAIGISTLLVLMGLILIARRLSRTHAVLARTWRDKRVVREIGLSADARLSWKLGVSVREYRELVEGGEAWPSSEVGERIEEFSGWPLTFVSSRSSEGG